MRHDQEQASLETRRGRPNRRQVLCGMFGLVAGPALPLSYARAAAAPHRVTLGAVEILVLSDGFLQVPLSFQLPGTPEGEVDALFKENGLEPPRQLTPATNVVLVRTGEELVLIDAGSGSTFQDTAGKLAENMDAAGLDREAVTKVVFTHAHADHLWGAIDDFDDSERFPNARYVMAGAEWEFWTSPAARSRMPEFMVGMARGSERVFSRLEPKLDRIASEGSLAPGLSYLSTPGHTPGHMAVLVESGREQVLIGGDVLAHPQISFQKPDWPIGSDTDRESSAATRRRLLDRLASDRTALIGFHLPWPGLGRVERAGSAYRFLPT